MKPEKTNENDFFVFNKTSYKVLKKRELIFKLNSEGKSLREISKLVGISYTSLSKFRRLWEKTK